MMRRRAATALALALSLAATRASAQAPSHASALVRGAAALAQALGAVPAGALVAASPLASDVPAPRGDELALRLATLLAGRLGGAPLATPTTLARAHALGARAPSVVYVQLELTKGELRATADLYPTVANSWDRLRSPRPGPRAHGFTSTPMDAEVRSFLTPILLEEARVHKVAHDQPDVLALGCGDVDGDGGSELVLVTRARVAIGKLREGKLAIVRAVPWAELGARAPVPLREPLATVALAPSAGELLVGLTDRASVALDAQLVVRRRLAGLPIPGARGEACTVPSPALGALEGSGVACATGGDARPQLAIPAARYDAVAALELVGRDGTPAEIVAAREPSGLLRLRRLRRGEAPLEAPIEGAGAELALADLDLDGNPEVAFSSDASEGDALSVWTWRDGGLTPRLHFPAAPGVRAIAACPPEERGLPALIAVVGSELWLVR